MSLREPGQGFLQRPHLHCPVFGLRTLGDVKNDLADWTSGSSGLDSLFLEACRVHFVIAMDHGNPGTTFNVSADVALLEAFVPERDCEQRYLALPHQLVRNAVAIILNRLAAQVQRQGHRLLHPSFGHAPHHANVLDSVEIFLVHLGLNGDKIQEFLEVLANICRREADRDRSSARLRVTESNVLLLLEQLPHLHVALDEVRPEPQADDVWL